MSDPTARNRAHAMEACVFAHCTDHPGSRVVLLLDSYAEVVSPAFDRRTLRRMTLACVFSLGLAWPFLFVITLVAKPTLFVFTMQPNGWILRTWSAYDPIGIKEESDFANDDF